MTYSPTLPNHQFSSSSDMREVVFSLLLNLNSDLVQLHCERTETLAALNTEEDPEMSQLISDALDAIDFEISWTNQEMERLSSLFE